MYVCMYVCTTFVVNKRIQILKIFV